MSEKHQTINYSFFQRLHRAIFNRYPFTAVGTNPLEFTSTNMHKFWKSKLAEMRDYKIQTVPLWTNIAGIASIVGLILAPILALYPGLQLTTSLKLILLTILFMTFGFYWVLLLLVWNDKKNYCNIYEQMLKENHDILTANLENLFQIYETRNLILGDYLHTLAEELRTSFHFTDLKICDDKLAKEALTRYLNQMCKITTAFHLPLEDEIGLTNLDKYACCIKTISPEQLHENIPTSKLQFKTLVRSTLPSDAQYKRRIHDFSNKYDNRYENLSENTDFKEILEERRWYYYLADFAKYAEKQKYKTSHPEGHLYYKSAVTFPIIYRYDSTSILLGYLCFDNFAPNAFPSCEHDVMNNEKDKNWELFCCSQIDLLSIILARMLKLEVTRNFNPTLAIGLIKGA